MENIRFKEGQRAVELPVSDLLAQVTHSDGDIVVLCGTLVTGYGNANSDFDVHVFCDELPIVEPHHFDVNDWISNDQGQWLDRATLQPGQRMKGLWNFWDDVKRAVDVKYWLVDEYQAYLQTFRDRYDDAIQKLGYLRSSAYGLYGIGDNTALAKIFEGRCALGGDRFDAVNSILSKDQYCYLAYRYHLPTYDDFRDAAGAFVSEDYDNAVAFARKYAELTGWAFSHLLGNPNTNRKWVLEMVKRWPAPYDSLSARFVELYFRGLPDVEARRRFVLDVVALCDEILAASVPLQRQNPAFDFVDETRAFWAAKLGQDAEAGVRSEQLRLEYDWYARNFSDLAIPGGELIEMHRVEG